MILLVAPGDGAAEEPAVTMLASFEDASVAARITEVQNIPAADCAVRRASVPARGQASLAVEIGATARSVSVSCDLTFREPMRFGQADRVAAFCWLTEGQYAVSFRIRDERHQVFETAPQTITLQNRWVLVTGELGPDKLRRLSGDGPLTYPIEILGFRVGTDRLGKQTIYLDDMQVEHRVEPRELVLGGFEFSEPTRIYEPGSSVRAAVVLENRSRQKALELSVDLAWMRPDGSLLQTQRAEVRLPASGADFRSNRKLDFSQAISEPGLYRLVAQVRAADWPGPSTVETAIAVTPSNRRLSRGRSGFFAVCSNLLREPELDQALEIRVARDIGVNLLAIETPWRGLAPKPGAFDFRLLENVLRTWRQKDIEDMGIMMILSEPPEWIGKGASRPEALAALITAVTDHTEQRVLRYQVDATALGALGVAAQLEMLRDLRDRVAKTHPRVVVLPPAISADDLAAATAVGAFLQGNPDFPLVVRTIGDPDAGRRQLEAFRKAGGFEWKPKHWWMHVAEPLTNLGYYADAEVVFRHYVAAAAAGVGGVIWYDLRDDENDPGHRDEMRGLMRRDFSPKASLLGYAAAAGQLTNYRYAGEVFGAPDGFSSALFIGGDRHIAVLQPLPNRIRPAVLAPLLGVPGELHVVDFERRERPVLSSAAPPLVPTSPRPLFMALSMTTVQPEPQLGLGRPWLRVPATAFCGAEAKLGVEIDAPLPMVKSYMQLNLPKDSPVESSFTATTLRAGAGETIQEEIYLRPKPDVSFESTPASLLISLEGEKLEVPLEVRPLTAVVPLASGQSIGADVYRIASLTAPASRRAMAQAALHVAYDRTALHLALVVYDQALVPLRTDTRGDVSGDQLLFGVAREGNDYHAEVRLNPADERPTLEPVYETAPAQVEGCRCDRLAAGKEGSWVYRLTVPAKALGVEALASGTRLLLAARYIDDDADGFPPTVLTWGGGLDGSRSTAGFRWIELRPAGK